MPVTVASKLPTIEGPTIICTQAGNVNTGAFDPIGDICDIARPKGAWVHVDGAFGMWAAMSITAEYLLTDSEHRNPSDFVPELSRRARGVDVWAALRTLARQGLEEMIDRCCGHARRFAEGFRAAGFEILNKVVLNQVLVAFGDDALTRKIIDAIQRDGTCWCGVTVWQEQTAMRISVSNWSTTAADVDISLAAMIRIAQETR